MFLLALQLLAATVELPVGIMNRTYEAPPLELLGGARCRTVDAGFRIVRGALPQGLTLSSRGSISGTPRQEGRFSLQIEAASGCRQSYFDVQLQIQGGLILHANQQSVSWVWKHGESPPAGVEVLVDGNWPDLAYSIEGVPLWLEVSARLGALPPRSSAFEADMVVLKPKVDGLVAGKHKATLVITAWGASRSPPISVELVVQ